MEIKKVASPRSAGIKHFKVLAPVQKPEKFGGMNELKVDIQSEGVICMARDLLPVDEKTGMSRCG